jgi:conjugative relaxase-like TrwC/TraI family protein
VLTIRAARHPEYYEQAEFARDDYYAERGQSPGVWAGRGAAALGLRGVPEPGELGALLAGRHPWSGAPLRDDGRQSRNAGFDLTFAAPKSVSVLYAVGDDRVRAAVLAGHHQGVAAALDYLERHELQARRGRGGERIIGAEGLIGARYTHELSRAGDPHLHTHVVVANLVRADDGRYSAPDMRPIYAAAKTAGTLAEAVSRAALTRALGLEWEPVARSGAAEIRGIAEAVLTHFSSRRAEIEELATVRGVGGMGALAALQRETRDRKPELERDACRADWRARAAEHGFGVAELAAVLGRRADQRLGPGALRALAERMAGPEGLTKQVSTFSRRDVLRAFAEAHPAGASLERLERLADGFLAAVAVEVEPAEPERGRRASYSTPDLLRAEERLLAAAIALGAKPAPAASGPVLERVLAAWPALGADQVAAVRHLTSGPERTRVLEAHAGHGKTSVLSAVADAYFASGVEVLGTAWQGQAAQHLGAEAGLPAETVARLLSRLGRGEEAVPHRGVVVVDEAATVPTRALAALAQAVVDKDGRLILVGDRAQLPAVDAGGGFAALADRLGAAERTENRRQRDPLQRAVADHLSEGRAAEALGLLQEHGRLMAFAHPAEARAQLIGDWARAALAEPAGALILAHDREDVRLLNASARERLDRAGLLGPERLMSHGREWAAGDRLACRRNDYRPEVDVRNGTRGTVVAVDPQRGSLRLLIDGGRQVVLPPDYLEHAHHAYALTGHVSQGATVERTYLLASPERGGAEWAYVAASRHRIDLRLYATHTDPEGGLQALEHAWARRQAKRLAVDRIDVVGRSARDVGKESARATRSAGLPTPAAPGGERLAELRAELGLLERALGSYPAEAAERLRALEARASGARETQRVLQDLVERREAQLRALRPWRRGERRELRLELARNHAGVRRLDEAIRRADEAAAEIRHGADGPEAWERAHVGVRARHRAVCEEIGRLEVAGPGRTCLDLSLAPSQVSESAARTSGRSLGHEW